MGACDFAPVEMITMLDHVSITVTDFTAAESFYDATLNAIDVVKIGSDRDEGWIGYGLRCDAQYPHRTYLSIRRGPLVGNAPGRHWCFKAPNRLAVDAFWRAGLIHGGTDDGAPGLRHAYHPSCYAAFLIDPSGNRIEAVCHHSE
jgi:catechol 2,3-dioxygenase-like lactoylglutathione lyase family enzyme